MSLPKKRDTFDMNRVDREELHEKLPRSRVAPALVLNPREGEQRRGVPSILRLFPALQKRILSECK